MIMLNFKDGTAKGWFVFVAILLVVYIYYYQGQKEERENELKVPNLKLLSDCLSEKKVVLPRDVLGRAYYTSKHVFDIDSLAENHDCLGHLPVDSRMDTLMKELEILYGSTHFWGDLVSHIQKERLLRNEMKRWLGNQLPNGSNPYKEFWGNPIKAHTQNSLTIKNTSNDDVIIVLMRYADDSSIGDYYVQAQSEYVIEKIPNSRYYIKQFSGTDWNPEKKMLLGLVEGGFVNSNQFSSSKNESSMDFLDDGSTYSTFELTLETTNAAGNEFHDSKVDPTSFFAK